MNDQDRHLRTRRVRAGAVVPTTAAVLLIGVAVWAVGGLARPGVATPVAPDGPTAVNRPTATTATGRIVLRLPDGTATATLADTAAAHELASMLPLRLELRDPMGQAKSGPLPRPLSTVASNTTRVLDPETDGVYYWPPTGDLAVFYDDLGQTVPPPGLVRLGGVTEGLDTLAGAGRRFTVTVERV